MPSLDRRCEAKEQQCHTGLNKPPVKSFGPQGRLVDVNSFFHGRVLVISFCPQALGRRGCNRRASWPPSLSLGR